MGWRVFPLWCLAERRIGTLCVDKVAFQDMPSPTLKNRPVGTRRLPRRQRRSPRQDTVKVTAWETCQAVLDEKNCEHGFSEALVRPRVPKHICISKRLPTRLRQRGTATRSWKFACGTHPSSSSACGLSDAVVLGTERDLWLFLLSSP